MSPYSWVMISLRSLSRPSSAAWARRLLQGRRWFDQPNRRPVFDLRIHRVSDIGAGRDLLYVDVRGNVVDLLVDRSLIRPSLPSLLVQASDEIGRNFA